MLRSSKETWDSIHFGNHAAEVEALQGEIALHAS